MNEEIYKKVKESLYFYLEIDCNCDSEDVCNVCKIAQDVASGLNHTDKD